MVNLVEAPDEGAITLRHVAQDNEMLKKVLDTLGPQTFKEVLLIGGVTDE